MPALSPTMSTGSIVRWHVEEGATVGPGDQLCEVETDKATLDWEAQEEGTVAKILVAAGTRDVPVGTPVMVIVDEGESIEAFATYSISDGGGTAAAAAVATSAAAATEAPAAPLAPTTKAWPSHSLHGMPALSPTMATGNVVRWHRAVGDTISAGDQLCEVETDKATLDWEAQEDGVLAAILQPDGTRDVAVNDPMCIIVDDAEDAAAFASYTLADALAGGASGGGAGAALAATAAAVPAVAPPAATAPPAISSTHRAISPPRAAGTRIVASPRARALAASRGVDLATVAGTGPGGRVVEADVLSAAAGGGSPLAPVGSATAGSDGSPGPSFVDVPASQIRRVIASRLLSSKLTVPHYYLSMDVSLDALQDARRRLNAALAAQSGGGGKGGGDKAGSAAPRRASVNDFAIRAAALALKVVPEMNAQWRGDSIRQFATADVSVAVQTDAGLLVPVVRGACGKNLAAIGEEVRSLAARARAGTLAPEDMTGGTFTISNLGMYGIRQFAAVINAPQAGILALGAARVEPVPTDDGGFRPGSVLTATVSADHRVVDGAVGAEWLAAFKRYMEDPLLML